MNTSNRTRPLYVYLQRPDTADWVVVGRYLRDPDRKIGTYKYAPSYADQGLTWPIDPVNLPFLVATEHIAHRYGGLHDVLRDACPDAWGQLLLRIKYDLPGDTSPVEYLRLAGNGDRWGALAIGTTPKPSVAALSSPKLQNLEELTAELLAISENRPPVNSKLRKQLFATPSLGGARPKASVQDGDSFWLVKPSLRTDTVDLAMLEHATQQWGREAGLNFADTRHHSGANGTSVVRVLRFDRRGGKRIMAVSAASLLQVEYPFTTDDDYKRSSYPRLAEELKRIGAPKENLVELFGRMIFNALVGNDDDHPRNHAVIFDIESNRWCLSPAFDVVPNPDEHPKFLVMQVSTGRRDINREAILADFSRFGFAEKAQAERYLDTLISKIVDSFPKIKILLNEKLSKLMTERLQLTLSILGPPERADLTTWF